MKLLINIVAFNIGWLACVMGASHGLPWLGPIVVAIAVSYHLRVSERPAAELDIILVAAFVGLVWDSVMVSMGWLSFPNGIIVVGTAPYWIIAMWVLFATTLNVTWQSLHGKPLLAAVLGAVFGPLSYLAGEKLGGVTIIEPTVAYVALGLAWAVFFPALLKLAEHFQQSRIQTEPAL